MRQRRAERKPSTREPGRRRRHYGMVIFAIIAVFVAGLMVGRTPEYLGKKIEAFEMKMASLCILIPPAITKIGAAIAVSTPIGTSAITNPGPHGFSQVLYWASS